MPPARKSVSELFYWLSESGMVFATQVNAYLKLAKDYGSLTKYQL
jgi:hypothetical protein